MLWINFWNFFLISSWCKNSLNKDLNESLEHEAKKMFFDKKENGKQKIIMSMLIAIMADFHRI